MISVIIPVYNSEKYLERTLTSISAQTLKDFEVIIVDDGSTDGSLSIMKRFADEDNRFRIVSRPNGGQSAARNTGIVNARGEWIYFIDADDTARSDALELLLKTAVSSSSSLVIGGYFEAEQENWSGPGKSFQSTIMTPEETLKIALYQKRRINSACGVLISADILRDERFTEGLYYEDLDLFPRMCLKSCRITYCPEPLYFYRQHPESFIHTFSPRRLDSLRVTDRILALIREKMPQLERAALDRRMSAAFNVLILLEKYRPTGTVPEQYRQYGKTYEEIAGYCFNIIRENRRASIFDSSVRLKNKFGALLSYSGHPIIRRLSRLKS